MRTREQTIYPQSGTVRRSHSSLTRLLKGSAPAGPFFLVHRNTLNIRDPGQRTLSFALAARPGARLPGVAQNALPIRPGVQSCGVAPWVFQNPSRPPLISSQ